MRSYLLAQPSRPAEGRRPLVIVLHGAGASAGQVMGQAFPPSPLSVWLEIAERENVVVLAADAGAGGWSDCFASVEKVAKKDDVAFISALIDKAVAEYDVDAGRVYLIGVSRGGLLAYRAAVEIPHKLAAFSVALSCMPPPHAARPPTVALPALIIGCTADPLMPYRGGKYFYTLGFLDPVCSIEDSARTWRELAGLPDQASVLELPKLNHWDKTRATRWIWGDAADGLQVGLYKIENGGHAEPSITKRYPYFINKLVGRQNADFEVAEAAWDFFKDKRAAR
ncbi:alpha/beta fold hydrolase [Rugamonas sp. FT107W]|uniref:Alpha/beta fold hydrolase n=1 Tax=Duganella vulcania TaxID=2692166 RepID=A0A845HNU5_9BURK|nr:alpha/beta fold hydrolase [Duganella vulcania]MYN19129.1 alpha/beta fold hydrolase [Duganella vulcania]